MDRSRPAPINDSDWLRLVDALPFLARLSPAMIARVRPLADEFNRRKTFTGIDGLEVTALMRHAISVQACLPINRLALAWYDDFQEIVIYPGQFVVDRLETDDDGVVHHRREALAGEVLDGGPVVLSWDDIEQAGGADQPCNVVIHEFAHKLDLADGLADGCPPLRPAQLQRWRAALEPAYDTFCRMCDRVERAIPRRVDPESEDAEPYWAQLPLDPYAATDPAEFFAVISEAYFTAPESVNFAFRDFYVELQNLYGE